MDPCGAAFATLQGSLRSLLADRRSLAGFTQGLGAASRGRQLRTSRFVNGGPWKRRTKDPGHDPARTWQSGYATDDQRTASVSVTL